MPPVFVDTSAWYALYVPDDDNHQAAWAWLSANQQRLALTDYIFDETLTLLKARGEHERAQRFGVRTLENPAIALEYVSPGDFVAAWQVFRRYDDKVWSFTDCTSRVVMERLGVQEAFAFDDDFRQFGTVTVSP